MRVSIFSPFSFVVNSFRPLVTTLSPSFRQAGKACDVDRGVGYETICVQKYATHKLFAVSDVKPRIELQKFSFPSCCVCHRRNSLASRAAEVAPIPAAVEVEDRPEEQHDPRA